MSLKTLLAALAVSAGAITPMLVAPAAHAQQTGWIYMGDADDGSRQYVRPGYDNSTYGYRRVWLKSTNDPSYGPGYYLISLTEFNCAAHTMHTIQNELFDAQGNVVQSHGSYGWQYVTPDSVADHAIALACR